MSPTKHPPNTKTYFPTSFQHCSFFFCFFLARPWLTTSVSQQPSLTQSCRTESEKWGDISEKSWGHTFIDPFSWRFYGNFWDPESCWTFLFHVDQRGKSSGFLLSFLVLICMSTRSFISSGKLTCKIDKAMPCWTLCGWFDHFWMRNEPSSHHPFLVPIPSQPRFSMSLLFAIV